MPGIVAEIRWPARCYMCCPRSHDMITRPSTLLPHSHRNSDVVASPMARLRRLAVSGLCMGALGLGLGACTVYTHDEAHARVYDYDATTVQAAPVNIETYPTVEYRGSPAYLVQGRWYYRHQNRWVVFNREP